MDDQNRIIDATPLIEAARADAGRHGARIVTLSVAALWRLIHQAPVDAVRNEGVAAAPNAR